MPLAGVPTPNLFRVYMAKWHELLVAVKILLNTGWDNTEEGAAAAISLSNPVLENLHKAS